MDWEEKGSRKVDTRILHSNARHVSPLYRSTATQTEELEWSTSDSVTRMTAHWVTLRLCSVHQYEDGRQLFFNGTKLCMVLVMNGIRKISLSSWTSIECTLTVYRCVDFFKKHSFLINSSNYTLTIYLSSRSWPNRTIRSQVSLIRWFRVWSSWLGFGEVWLKWAI